MFFSGLDLAQPAKTRRANIRTTDQDYQSPLKMILGVIFLFLPINHRVKRLSPETEKREKLALGTAKEDRNLTLIFFMLYLTS